MADEAKEETALDRLKKAVADKPKHAYAKVLAADVVGVGGLVEADKHTRQTADCVAGAERAIAERPAADPESIEVLQVAGQVATLIALAEAE